MNVWAPTAGGPSMTIQAKRAQDGKPKNFRNFLVFNPNFQMFAISQIREDFSVNKIYFYLLKTRKMNSSLNSA